MEQTNFRNALKKSYTLFIPNKNKNKTFLDNIETPLFPVFFTCLSVFAYLTIFYISNRRYIEECPFETMIMMLIESGVLLFLNAFLILWLIVLFTISRGISEKKGFISRSAKIVYLSSSLQPLIVILFYILYNYRGGLISSISYGLENRFPNEGQLIEMLFESIRFVLFLVLFALCFLRALCIFNGFVAETKKGHFLAIFSVLPCLDSWYYLYHSLKFFRFVFLNWTIVV